MKNLMIIALFTVSTNIFAQNNSVEAFKNSYIYESQANYAKAIDAFKTVDSKKSYTIYLRLGWLYYINANYMKSKVYYQKAIQLKSTSIEAELGLIYPLKALYSWDEVIVAYQSILVLDPKNTTANYQLAYIYFVRKNFSQAENYLKTVLKLYPFDYDSNTLLATVYVKLGKIKEAKFHYTKALEYNPSATEIKSILKGL